MSSQALVAIQNAGFKLFHQPSYLPDFAESDYYLIPILKEFMKGSKFADDDSSMATGWLEEHDQQFLYCAIQALEKCWTKCISVAEDYVEK